MTISEINRSSEVAGSPKVPASPTPAVPEAAAGEVVAAAPAPATSAATPAVPRADAPARPSLHDKVAPPVLVKLPPPFTVRLSQIFWVLSLVAGAVAIVYLFVIRQTQLPLISDMVRAVDGTRADATYTTAADIIFWSIFGLTVAIVLLQIVFQVSFSNRRPRARWWQFGSLMFLAGVVLIAREMVAVGEQGAMVERILLLQVGLGVVGLLFGLLPNALRWTARQYDVRRGPVAPAGSGQL